MVPRSRASSATGFPSWCKRSRPGDFGKGLSDQVLQAYPAGSGVAGVTRIFAFGNNGSLGYNYGQAVGFALSLIGPGLSKSIARGVERAAVAAAERAAATAIEKTAARAAGETALAAAEGTLAAGERGGVTRLFRAVSPAELADIQATGEFRPSPTGLEGKYFSTTAEGASQYARMAVRGFGDAPYTIVETTMPNGTAPLAPFVDRGISTVVVPNSALPALARPIIWSFMPIP